MPQIARPVSPALAVAAALSGCTPEAAAPRGELDARGQFEAVVQPQLSAGCLPCHGNQVPFLQAGAEYLSITKYKGGLFLTQPPELSYLLHRGEHQGPALTTAQALDALTWLRLEGQQTEKPVPVTPTVAASPGEFYLSLKGLVGDPQARITFKIEPLPRSPGDLLLSELKLKAGPEAGISVKHPRFIVSSGEGVLSDPADSLSNVELNVKPGEARALGPGGVILTAVPQIASLAVAFAAIERTTTDKPAACKALEQFNRAVRPTLQSACAASCHGGGNSVATNAFDMRAAAATDEAARGRFCLDARGRTDSMNAMASVLIKQPTPESQGGTKNHPFKLQDPAPFRQAVLDWVAAENKP